MNHKLSLSVCAVMMAVLSSCGDGHRGAACRAIDFADDSFSEEERIEAVLADLTLDEKIAMLHAQSKFSSPGVPRLGIPDIWCTDGPHGIRPEVAWDEWKQAGWTNDSSTAYPALTCLAATWDRELSLLYGKSIGEEARYRRKNVLLGPGVNICRTPLNGRNFEYMGEDPYLAGQMVVPYVQGVQENGVAACVKHYALNNQEVNRHTTEVTVDDRTLHEIYLPAFKAAVQEGHAWTIMGAYNYYKGEHNCHNSVLLNDILKRDWGFDGAVVSDWGGTHDTDESIRNGLDLEYGSWTNGLSYGRSNAYDDYYLAEPYKRKILAGEYGTEELDNKVRRILKLQLRTNYNEAGGYGRFTCPDHYAAARKIGSEGIVLLKNDGNILPIEKAGKILVVGENAIKMLTVGGGSSNLKVKQEILPLDGIIERFSGESEVVYERGYIGSYSDEFDGVKTGQNIFDPRSEAQLLSDAVAAAKTADYVIYVGGLNKDPHQDCEDADRLVYDLPYNQDALIEALAEVNDHLVVVNISGTPVSMPWADKVPAIVQDWYLGSEAGRSLADVLSGDVNPSGKLPFTFPMLLSDGPIKTELQYPGILDEAAGIWRQTYTEGIFVGYRWYEHHFIVPRFPFGYGMSYTEFEYGDAKLSSSVLKSGKTIELTIPITNTGSRDGAEVVQLYISDPECSVERPVKELKDFTKVYLKAGETKTVKFTISEDALKFYDVNTSSWVAESGEFVAHVGASSADVRSSVTFTL